MGISGKHVLKAFGEYEDIKVRYVVPALPVLRGQHCTLGSQAGVSISTGRSAFLHPRNAQPPLLPSPSPIEVEAPSLSQQCFPARVAEPKANVAARAY